MRLARSFVSLPAGHACVPLEPFVAMTVLGCAIWAAVFTLAGVLAGAGWSELSATVGDLLLAVAARALWRWRFVSSAAARVPSSF